MSKKVLINQIELAYSPMSNYDFSVLKRDSIIQKILSESNLYIISQRPVISFENIENFEDEEILYFEIHQKNNEEILKVKLPLFQENLAIDRKKEVKLYVGSHDPDTRFNQTPLKNVHGIKFFQGSKFLVWFSPEKFLQNYWKGHFRAEIEGNFKKFTEYRIHYVGKATKQEVWKRLTGHNTLQEILSLEYPFTYGQLPTHEISILFLKFKENLQIHSWGGDQASKDDVIASLLGTNMPEQSEIFLDAEKALIKAMQPKYNKEGYINYPKSKDGLYKRNYTAFSYSFTDPITLCYHNDEIRGGLHQYGGDTILVKDNRIVEVKKANMNNTGNRGIKNDFEKGN